MVAVLKFLIILFFNLCFWSNTMRNGGHACGLCTSVTSPLLEMDPQPKLSLLKTEPPPGAWVGYWVVSVWQSPCSIAALKTWGLADLGLSMIGVKHVCPIISGAMARQWQSLPQAARGGALNYSGRMNGKPKRGCL